MPIVLAPPSPLGSASSIGVGAGIAEQNAKMFPTLASLYAHIASLHGSRGGGASGTQGSSSVSPGYGGQGAFPSGYDPASEQQANRDQQTQNLQTELSADPVAKHLQMQHNFRLQQDQQRQQAEAALNQRGGQPGPPTQVPDFNQNDVESLAKAQQGVANIDQLYESGEFDRDDPNALKVKQELQGKIASLQQKQQAASEYKDKQSYQAQSAGMARQRALIDTDEKHVAENGYKQIPDVVAPNYGLDKDGKQYLKNKEVFQASVEAKRRAEEHNNKMDLEKLKLGDKAVKIKQDAELHEQKLEQAATTGYINIRKHEIDRLNKEEDAFMKEGSADGGTKQRASPEGFDNTIAERMKAHGFPGTIGEFVDNWQKKRGLTNPGQAQAHSADSEPLTRSAKPEVVAEAQAHIGTMPRLPTGQPDLPNSSPEQLDRLRKYYSEDHKSIGVSAENAAKWVKAIDAAKANQAIPTKDFEHAPPQASRFGRGASRIAGEASDNARELGRRVTNLGELAGVNETNTSNFNRGAGVIGGAVGEVVGSARSAARGVADRIDRGGANTYGIFKRWLGK